MDEVDLGHRITIHHSNEVKILESQVNETLMLIDKHHVIDIKYTCCHRENCRELAHTAYIHWKLVWNEDE